MSLARRWLFVAALAAGITLLAAGAPLAFRGAQAFRAERVEVVGGRFLSAEEAIAATGIGEQSTLFDDFEPLRIALERHPLVLRATVHRRLPATIVFDIVEAEPLALLVSRRRSRPVDVRGQVLPVDATKFELDLPVLDVDAKIDSAGRLTDRASRTLVRTLDHILRAQPWLAAWTSELRWESGSVHLTLRWPAGAEVVLPAVIDDSMLHALRLTVADLVGAGGQLPGATGETWREPEGGGELARLIRIDARYRDQMVVRLGDVRSRERARGAS